VIRYRLRPRGAFHFGERGIGLEETAELPHSDTIFAALVSAWRTNRGSAYVDKLVAHFPVWSSKSEASPTPAPVRLSSAFPYADSVHFLPRPMIHLTGQDGDPKVGKRVEFIAWSQMESLLGSVQAPLVRREDTLQQGRLWCTVPDRAALPAGVRKAGRVWLSGAAAMVPRVTIDRASSASALYHQGQVWFLDGCGLYVLADYADDDAGKVLRKAVEEGLAILGDLGLGGRRAVGLGQFHVESSEEIELRGQGGAADPHLLLSLYHPRRSEVAAGVLDDARGAQYEFIVRGGWLQSPDRAALRRRGIRMLREGSIVASKPAGDVVDVRPEKSGDLEMPHAVYRSGLALAVPCARWHHVG
jgi:CRISPR-associated protein Csm4